MRLILGVILGIFVSIGVAYVHDGMVEADQKRVIVNWDAFHAETRGIGDAASNAWDRLAALIKRRGELTR